MSTTWISLAPVISNCFKVTIKKMKIFESFFSRSESSFPETFPRNSTSVQWSSLERWGPKIKIIKKVKCDQQTDRPTHRPTKRGAESRNTRLKIWYLHIITKTIFLDGPVRWNLKHNLTIRPTECRSAQDLLSTSLVCEKGSYAEGILSNFTRFLPEKIW